MPTPPPPSHTYPASCHCGSVQYTVTLSPPLTDPTREVFECNCSICSRNGYLLVYAKHEDVNFTAGEEILERYTFAKARVAHFFCPQCGSSLFAKSLDASYKPLDIKAVNVRQFHDLDLARLKIRGVDGRSA
ncbi:uncharacterized protein BDZ99DRAFT_106240 [Mytilinidion resinicola]|uniref:CENP-V/GFA domain-containing protein n=1 Tax=Mytilinidion resinicola TaxID=574789 RepID=A0A6A6YBV1_9PEZI|nr:uncharacterized protein BDZ99DRAFT_106240 [Mytilinidion resinicola]KAF2805494.1 hypothetical protein BDZ99DRAFT_106240 [Mytilinidion resinicola]